MHHSYQYPPGSHVQRFNDSTIQRFNGSTLQRFNASTILLCFLLTSLLIGCKKDEAREASQSDANGYLCLSCGAKLYTPRSTFIGPNCPKCNKDTLREVVGYVCPKDHHMTMRPQSGGGAGAGVCEQCQAPLVNAMYLPKEKDLLTWGALKAVP